MTPANRSVEFVALWSEHARRVYGLIYSLVPNWNDADDILQETSVVLLEKFEEFTPGTSFFAWAGKVAYLKVLEYQRRNRLQLRLSDEFFASVFAEVEGSVIGLDRQLDALAACMEQLAGKDRDLLQLRYRDDFSVTDVANAMGRTSSAVYKALARVHAALLMCVRGKLTEGERP